VLLTVGALLKWVCLIAAGIALAFAYYSESLSGLERLALDVILALSAARLFVAHGWSAASLDLQNCFSRIEPRMSAIGTKQSCSMH
jgi:hypothetical protein